MTICEINEHNQFEIGLCLREINQIIEDSNKESRELTEFEAQRCDDLYDRIEEFEDDMQ